jgi:hypothetical protein
MTSQSCQTYPPSGLNIWQEFFMIKSLGLVLIVTLLTVRPAFAQDANRAEQTAETQPVNTSEPQVRQSDLRPSPVQPDTPTEKQSSSTRHKKRNVILAVVVAVAVGVAIAAHNGLYGSSKGY